MKNQSLSLVLACLIVVSWVACGNPLIKRSAPTADMNSSVIPVSSDLITQPQVESIADPVLPMPEAVQKGLTWLVRAQTPSGGWGAGLHSQQQVRDPGAVQTDPATTAFAAMALMRSGNTLKKGPHQENLQQALEYLLLAVERTSENESRITQLTGTQPQRKLGQNIDVSMTVQFLSRILPEINDNSPLKPRTEAAISKCLRKIEDTQEADGSFRGGTWAGVLQSAMANNALEDASGIGMAVDSLVLEKSRAYQKGNIDVATGAAKTESSAGISLYSISSSNRATSKKYKRAQRLVRDAKAEGKIAENAEVSAETLKDIGLVDQEAEEMFDDVQVYEATKAQMQNEQVLSGFGNNGGEEFLSYMMTSESLIRNGGEDWTEWNEKMKNRLTKIQNPDGSWSGHHCITSPVFCTAAVILTLTAEQDATLQAEAKE